MHDPAVRLLRDGLTRLDLSRDNGHATAWLAAVPGSAFAELEARADHWLSAGELAYRALLEVPSRRQSYLLGRVAAKRAILQYLGFGEPREVTVDRGVFDQPVARVA